MNPSRSEPKDPTERLLSLLNQRESGWLARHRAPRILGGLALLILAGVWFYSSGRNETQQPRYHTEPATVGSLVVKVSATGNLQPTNQVDVGSELSGIVDSVYVDENDRVRKGQVLARLDLAKLRDAVARSRANLASAEAQVRQAQATLAEARATLVRLEKLAELSGGKVPAASEMDAAVANLRRAEANEAIARAAVAQARAMLQTDETNLRKAYIRSPIDGVVLTRQVEPGQTVAASFQAPVLFKIAEDLTKMELRVDVDEADVGQVRVGQPAVFTVDAWPGRSYPARIVRVGYGSQVKEGVVSYPTVLKVDNHDLSLRPGMTATVEITTLTRENVLLVPNAALRFTPTTTEAEKTKRNTLMSILVPRPTRTQPRRQVRQTKGPHQQVWVLREGRPVAVAVQTGATDGRMTEIVGGDLAPGMEVITEMVGRRP